MVFYIIGLGLGDETDVTIKGFNAIKKSHKIYLEAYTSILGVNKASLEKFYEKVLILFRKSSSAIEKPAKRASIRSWRRFLRTKIQTIVFWWWGIHFARRLTPIFF